jgi:DNA replication protein DnaC
VAALATLAAGAWIDAGEPVVLLGESGTGKTHYADLRVMPI